MGDTPVEQMKEGQSALVYRIFEMSQPLALIIFLEVEQECTIKVDISLTDRVPTRGWLTRSNPTTTTSTGAIVHAD